MAAVSAECISAENSDGGQYVPSPSLYPSWMSSGCDYVETQKTSAGYTTSWTSHGLLRLSISDEHIPNAACLAYFPPLDPVFCAPSSHPMRTASLVTASDRFITIATPGSDAVRTPLSDPILDPQSATHLFTPPCGIIIRSANPPFYYYLSHPLQLPVPIQLPDDHTILHAFLDVPIIVTRTKDQLSLWSFVRIEEPISRFSQHELGTDNCGEDVVSAMGLRFIHLFKTALQPDSPATAFLSHDAHGFMVLCIVSDHVLTGLSISETSDDSFNLVPSFRIRDVTSAVAVLAVRRPHATLDTLVRHSNGTFSLFMGRNRLCTVTLSDVSSAYFLESVLLVQSVADEFSLAVPNKASERYSLRNVSFVSPLVNDCLAAITFAFEAAAAISRVTSIYHDLLAARASVSVNDLSVDGCEIEWSLFQDVLLRTASPAPVSCALGTTCNTALLTEAEGSCNSVSFFSEEDVDNYADENEVSDTDWHNLLRSDYYVNQDGYICLSPASQPESSEGNECPSKVDINVQAPDTLRKVLDALHLLYEDRKLDTLSGRDCRLLATLNHEMALVLKDFGFIDHYRRDFPHLVSLLHDEPMTSPQTSLSVPSIADHLVSLVRRSEESSYPAVSLSFKKNITQDPGLTASWRRDSPFELSRRLLRYYHLLFSMDYANFEPHDRYRSVLLAMVRDKMTSAEIEALPFGVSIPLRDVLWNCRQRPDPSWPYAAFALIGREDLFNFADPVANRQNVDGDDLKQVEEGRALLQMHAAAADTRDVFELPRQVDSQPAEQSSRTDTECLYVDEDGDGCDLYGAIFRLRFAEDKRVEEVRRMLRSTDITVMAPVRIPDENSAVEFDASIEQKRKLGRLLRKRFAAPVGRGAFTLRTLVPTDPTKPLPVPKVCTMGKIYAQKGTTVKLVPQELSEMQWGLFHNGVASGLRVVAADASRESETGQILTRSFIVNHRPTDSTGTATHAGMLLGLGLGGYLPVLRKTDYYQYLVPRHELTAIGLMLGLSAGNIGTSDEKISKMLCLHIRPFNLAGFAVPDFQISVHVQTAAILGLGFLHIGTCENILLDGLFSELEYRPKPGDTIDDREGLALAAGLAIGLICLGHGSSAFDAADRRKIDRLILYANGVSTEETELFNGLGCGPQNKLNSNDGGLERGNMTLAESEASRILEGHYVNTDVVSPGALMALTLIYMKSNERRVAERLSIPDSLYSMDRARPDHVYLRLLTRSLIMWDDINASVEWIRDALPPLLFPVSKNGGIFDLQGRIAISLIYREQEVDVNGILQARAFALAGVYTAIALKYAGSGDSKAIALLTNACESYEAAILHLEDNNESMEYGYMTGLCCAALSLSIVAAGSGDLEVLRLLRRLRKRRGSSGGYGRYGSHMAMHMATGFLFLGGGCQTFGTSDVAVVGLLLSIYPRFPTNTNDNQYHLQAFRHLYVVSVEPRCVEARDVDTGKWCAVDMEIALKGGSVLRKRAPCIVPQADEIAELRIVGDRYLQTVVDINRAMVGYGWYSRSRGQVVFVKRKAGHLPFSVDSKGAKGILARSLHRPKNSEVEDHEYLQRVGHLVRAFSADPEILAFVNYFCIEQENGKRVSERVKNYVEMVYESLASDKAQGVKLYFEIERGAETIGHLGCSPWVVQSLVLAEAYAESGSDKDDGCRLVNADFVVGVVRKVRQRVMTSGVQKKLVDYVKSGGTKWPVITRGEHCVESVHDVKGCNSLAVALKLGQVPAVFDMSQLSWRLKRRCANPDDDLLRHGIDEGLEGVPDGALEVIVDALKNLQQESNARLD